jgi:hypothetical protein|tara:strand:+ start:146 stop:418 length:273 start_codon:yes stop_codon:yes gene_type:complete
MITATDIAKSTPQEVLFPALSPPFRNGRRYTFGSLALAAAPVGAHTQIHLLRWCLPCTTLSCCQSGELQLRSSSLGGGFNGLFCRTSFFA